MDDDRIRQILHDYDPPLATDSSFMRRLERNVDSVEVIRQHLHQRRLRNRIAVVTAALSGFIAGLLANMARPYLVRLITVLADMSADNGISGNITCYSGSISWFIAGVACIATSWITYDITLALAATRQADRR